MNRREALKSVGFIFGTTIIGAEAFLSGCVNSMGSFKLSENDLIFLNTFAESILPETNTPGAKEADVASFMNSIVSDFYSTGEQKIFKDGISSVNQMARSKSDTTFIQLSAEDKNALLTLLEKEAQGYFETHNKGDHFYIMYKQLSVWGYLSSEIVARNAFIHAPLIEKYIGTINYKAGDKIVYTDFGRSGSAYGSAIHHIKNN